MPGVGIEPTFLSKHDFKSCAYTNSATRASEFYFVKLLRPRAELNRRIEILQISALPLGYWALFAFQRNQVYLLPVLFAEIDFKIEHWDFPELCMSPDVFFELRPHSFGEFKR